MPYHRPIPCDPDLPGAVPLAGGPLGTCQIETLSRTRPTEVLPVAAVPAIDRDAQPVIERITARRSPIAGLDIRRPLVMGILNVTPDSFSDGGRLEGPGAAVREGLALVAAGADILDVGGESTRPGAEPVPQAEELDRVIPVIEGLLAEGCGAPISIDTRKAAVARAALAAGARIVNDVSALTHDPAMAEAARGAEAVCLMHALGDPRTMQDDPRYGDVLLDIYDYLAERIEAACDAGIDRARLIVDPGIGFGKTLEHNVVLMRRLSLYHGLGCPILVGASRKRFIGRLSGVEAASERVAGSVAAALAAAAEGVQILRVHDVAATVQALRVWWPIRGCDGPPGRCACVADWRG